MATFTEDFARMRQEFDHSLQERQEFVQGVIDNEVEDGKNRQKFCNHIEQDCAERMENNQHQFNEMANQVRSELTDFAADLKTGGKIFNGNPAQR